jgi:exodeoxyribonuclease VII large subunit
VLTEKTKELQHARTLLNSVHPKTVLKRGFAILEKNGKLVSSVKNLHPKDILDVSLQDGKVIVEVK